MQLSCANVKLCQLCLLRHDIQAFQTVQSISDVFHQFFYLVYIKTCYVAYVTVTSA